MYIYGVVAWRVIDGDTLDLTVDTGFRNRHQDSFRLFGINCADKTDVPLLAQQATLYALAWFAQHAGPYEVRTEKDKQEKYGRYLATLMAADGHVLNDDLVTAGLAVKWDGKGPRPVPTGVPLT